MDLLSLPSELLIAVCSYLDPWDILAFCRTNRLTRSLFKESMLLQYTVLLFETGMEEHGPPFLREMRERISYLTSREKLWCSADLSGKRKFILNVTQRHSHIRNYSARVFMLGDLGPTPENLRTNGLWHVEMPTCLHRRDQRTWRQCKWSRLPLGIDALGIGVSLAGQDLIAVLSAEPSSEAGVVETFNLHLKQFSTGMNHPSAMRPTIPVYDRGEAGNHCVTSIEISGCYLVLLLGWLRAPLEPDRLYVYEWQTGTELMHVTREGCTYRGVAFLSDDTFIVTNLRDATIEVLKVRSRVANTSAPKVQWISKLALPTLHARSVMLSVTCRTDPIHVRSNPCPVALAVGLPGYPTAPNYPPSTIGAGIHCQSEQTLVEFRIYMQRDNAPFEGHVTYFSFVTRRSSILEHVGRSGQSTSSGIPTISWDTWGPKSTRWSGADEADAAWTSSVSGQRHVILAGERPQRIRVRDFNALAVRRVRHRYSSDDNPLTRVADGERIVEDEGITPHQDCFAEDIRSSLPFVETATKETFSYDGILTDEDHIIGLTLITWTYLLMFLDVLQEDEEDGLLRQLDVFVMSPEVPSPCNCK